MPSRDDLFGILEPVLSAGGVELVDLEYRREPVGWVLRLYLDKPGGFSLTDCEEWNDKVGDFVEEKNLIAQAYHLEISSPGLNRPLKKQADYEKYLGMDAVIKLYAPRDGQKNFHGRMVRVENGELTLEDRTSGFVQIPLSAVAGARLDPPPEI